MTSQRIAIVTGASRGIGRAIAMALAREGFAVTVNYASNAAAAAEVGQQIESAGGRALLVQADISQAADRQRLVDQTLAQFKRIDLLVNNAGVAPAVRADMLEATQESFDRMIEINLKGPYFLTQLVAREMIQEREGTQTRRHEGTKGKAEKAAPHPPTSPSPQPPPLNPEPRTLNPPPNPQIINITSISAYTASTNRGDYCIAKAGLAMMTRLYAARLAEFGINVYEIRPGVIETDMTGPVKAKYDDLIFNRDLTPIRRWGRPDDVARAVVAIATGLLPFSTGEVINVDGGFHLRRL